MLKHVWVVIWGAVRQAFELMPDFVALFLTAVGIAVIFMNETLKRLETRPRWRGFIIACFIIFGSLAFISNQIQKGQDSADKKALSDQIKILVDGSQAEATSADVRSLSSSISIGFERLEAAIKGINPPTPRGGPVKPPPTTPQGPPSAPQSIRFTSKRVPSTDPENPFGLQIIVQSDASVSPAGFAFLFTGEISKINFFLAGQPFTMMSQSFVLSVKPSVGIVRVGSPALNPDSPMVVTVFSKANVSVVSMTQINGTVNSPFTIP
jgi:hypothetical protein